MRERKLRWNTNPPTCQPPERPTFLRASLKRVRLGQGQSEPCRVSSLLGRRPKGRPATTTQLEPPSGPSRAVRHLRSRTGVPNAPSTNGPLSLWVQPSVVDAAVHVDHQRPPRGRWFSLLDTSLGPNKWRKWTRRKCCPGARWHEITGDGPNTPDLLHHCGHYLLQVQAWPCRARNRSGGVDGASDGCIVSPRHSPNDPGAAQPTGARPT